MKAVLTGITVAILIAAGSALVLYGEFQMSAEQAFRTQGVRR